MSNLLDYAVSELQGLIDQCKTDDEKKIQESINHHIYELLETFSNQYHSGFTGGYVLNYFNQLVNFRPIFPLTGEDSEWGEKISSINNLCQNKRCGRVFKEADGRAYDIDYYYILGKDGIPYSNRYCFQYIKFPYMPKESKKVKEKSLFYLWLKIKWWLRKTRRRS